MTKEPVWEPKQEDFQRVFLEQNPWWQTNAVPDAWAKTTERPLAAHLWQRVLDDRPRRFQVVLGPRRVGKSTAMYQTVRHFLVQGIDAHRLIWLRLDHPLLDGIPLGDIVQATRTPGATPEQPDIYFLDEMTYAAQWDRWLKTFYDEQWPLQMIATSSSTAMLRQRHTESGVGRWEEQYLAPYLFPEYLDLVGANIAIPVAETLAETLTACIANRPPIGSLESFRRRFLLTGGFPELLATFQQVDETSAFLDSQRVLKSDAVERAIYKDIPQAFNVDSPFALERLLYTLAGQITGTFSPQIIGQKLNNLSQPTVDRYISLLERAFILFTVPNYSGQESAVQRRGRKLYFIDGAVRNATLQRGIAPLSDPTEMGLLFENVVAGHLHALCQQTQTRLYHWRESHKYEVDLIYDHPTNPVVFEIGSSPGHGRQGLQKFREQYPRFAHCCYLVIPSALPLRPQDASDGIGILPLDLALLAIGGQAAQALEARLKPLSKHK